MKIFTGEIPKNPDCADCEVQHYKNYQHCHQCDIGDKFFLGQQSILNQCKEVDNKVLLEWLKGAEKLAGSLAIFGYPSLEQFIQSQMPEILGK